ncbi:MAG: hypothetical protein WBX25_30310 [Rhodomicrobium sp.]
MGKIQLQHIKLWQAIKRKNWDLLNYEADHLKESLSDAAIFYVNIPLEYINSADQPLRALQDAVKSKDPSRLARDYAALTAACNSCHQAAQVGFIEIITPASSPFGNQKFVPKD